MESPFVKTAFLSFVVHAGNVLGALKILELIGTCEIAAGWRRLSADRERQ